MKSKKIAPWIGAMVFCAQVAGASEKTVIRFGHFPNLTHAHGGIAPPLSRHGKGWFEERLGPYADIQWFTYTAGPSPPEAICPASLDLTFCCQTPPISASLHLHRQ